MEVILKEDVEKLGIPRLYASDDFFVAEVHRLIIRLSTRAVTGRRKEMSIDKRVMATNPLRVLAMSAPMVPAITERRARLTHPDIRALQAASRARESSSRAGDRRSAI